MVNNDTINEKFIEDILFNVPWIIESGFKIIERQKRIEVGIIDIFGKDNHGRYVVVEIKRDKPDDKVVGQITRYMGFMKEDLKLKEDQIRGIIFCKYTTKKLEFAACMVPNLKIIEYNPLQRKIHCLKCNESIIYSGLDLKEDRNNVKGISELALYCNNCGIINGIGKRGGAEGERWKNPPNQADYAYDLLMNYDTDDENYGIHNIQLKKYYTTSEFLYELRLNRSHGDLDYLLFNNDEHLANFVKLLSESFYNQQ